MVEIVKPNTCRTCAWRIVDQNMHRCTHDPYKSTPMISYIAEYDADNKLLGFKPRVVGAFSEQAVVDLQGTCGEHSALKPRLVMHG